MLCPPSIIDLLVHKDMKAGSCGFLIISASIFLQSKSIIAATEDTVVSLQAEDFEHIEFRKIKANAYSYGNQQLQIDVDSSASFLMKPFDAVKKVKKVSFDWQSEGLLKVEDAQHELKRSGDDAIFKLGLLLKSEGALPNPFLPSWMKRVQGLLKFPSENMINLVADARHVPGRQWLSPYNKRVTMISLSSVPDHQGWMRASYQFEQPVEIVAIWLMADGDNTSSRFTTRIKNIVLE